MKITYDLNEGKILDAIEIIREKKALAIFGEDMGMLKHSIRNIITTLDDANKKQDYMEKPNHNVDRNRIYDFTEIMYTYTTKLGIKKAQEFRKFLFSSSPRRIAIVNILPGRVLNSFSDNFKALSNVILSHEYISCFILGLQYVKDYKESYGEFYQYLKQNQRFVLKKL